MAKKNTSHWGWSLAVLLFVLGMVQPVGASSLLVGDRFDSGSSSQKLVHINRFTGAVTEVGTGVGGTPSIFNTATGLATSGIHSIIAQPIAQPTRLYSWDATNGAIVHSPTFSASVHTLRYGSSASIFGLSIGSGTANLISIDPANGNISTLGSGISNFFSLSGQAAYDPVNQVYSFTGSLNDAMGPRLFSLNTTNGNLLSSPLFSPPSSVNGMVYDQSGSILGLRFDAGTERLVTVNPSTAVVTDVGPGIINFGFVSSESSYDPMDNVYTFLGNRNAEAQRLFSLNATTGLIDSEPFLPGFINGLTYGPIPEPSGLVLACAAGLGLRRNRRLG